MLIPGSKEWVGYGGADKSNRLLGSHFWANFHRVRISKNIPARLIFHASLKWWADELNKPDYPKTKVRITEADFEELTETIVCGKQVAIVIYLDKPFGFLIEEELAAKSYMKFFDLLWQTAN